MQDHTSVSMESHNTVDYHEGREIWCNKETRVVKVNRFETHNSFSFVLTGPIRDKILD